MRSHNDSIDTTHTPPPLSFYNTFKTTSTWKYLLLIHVFLVGKSFIRAHIFGNPDHNIRKVKTLSSCYFQRTDPFLWDMNSCYYGGNPALPIFPVGKSLILFHTFLETLITIFGKWKPCLAVIFRGQWNKPFPNISSQQPSVLGHTFLETLRTIYEKWKP